MASPNSPSASEEPQPRHRHCTATVGGVSYTWGGVLDTHPDTDSDVVHCFHADDENWIKRPTTGEPPPGFVAAACTVVGFFVYIFAGYNGEDFFNSIHRLDTRSFVWSLLEPGNPEDAPMCKYSAAMTSYNGKILVTIGGYGPLPKNRANGVKYVPDPESSSGNGWTNELVCFDITTMLWFSPPTSGSSPPACAGCSLTRVDRFRSVFYGGYQLNSKCVRSTHILNMMEWAWSEVISSGGPGQSWPVARDHHSAVSLYDPDSDPADPAMMVMFGEDDDSRNHSDGWTLRVNSEQWRKVISPASLEGRSYHTTAIVRRDSTHCKLVHYGGADDDVKRLADTTVVDMECGGVPGEWVVTDVIPASQLGQPREKKHTLPKHVQLTLAEEMQHLTVCDRVMREKGKLVISVMQCMLSGPPRVGKSSLLSRLVPPPPEALQTPAAPDTPSTDTPPSQPLASQPTLSTGVAEGVLQVYVKSATQLIAVASPDHLERAWQYLALNVEAVTFLKTIISSFSTHSQESLPDVPAIAAASSDTPATSSPTAEGLGPTTSADVVKSKGGHALLRFKRRIGRANPATTALPGYKSIEEILRNAVKSEQWSDTRALLEGSLTLYLTDTGGQPECQEILPGLIAGPSLFLLVFSLEHSLNRRYKVQFVKSAAEKTVEYDSSFTVKEVLLQSLASIAATCTYSSLNSKDPIPVKARVMIVGTHSDLVTSEHIGSVQKELKESLKEMAYYKLLVFASKDEPVIVVNNMSTDESDFHKVRRLVERIAEQPAFRVPIPTPWLAFSLCLRLLEDSVPVISYEQCSSIAGECGIDTEEEVKEALWHLHTKMGVLRYFHSIPELQDIVIRKPQLIFSKITELIARTFTFENLVDPQTVEAFEQQGMFSVDAIAELTTTPSELLSSAKLVKLLEALHIIAPIRDETGKIVEYFIPCVLTHAPEYQAQDVSDSPVPSLLVTFKCGYCPKGLFCALVAFLLTAKVCCGLTWRLERKKMYQNRVSFAVGREHHIVSITAHLTHLEISLDSKSAAAQTAEKERPHVICSTIRQAMKESITAVSQTLHYGSDTAIAFGFSCPSCPPPPPPPHKAATAAAAAATAVCHEEDPIIMECPGACDPCDLSPHHRAWFGHDLVETIDDCLELGKQLGVPHEVLGTIQICCDEHGSKRQRGVTGINTLTSNPASWNRLCEALEEMGKNVIADKIRQKHVEIGKTEQPSELEVVNAISSLNQWFELGQQLGLPYHDLKEIMIDFDKYGTGLQRSTMVHTWLQREPAASWSKLCAALDRMGERALAQDIREKHSTGGGH